MWGEHALARIKIRSKPKQLFMIHDNLEIVRIRSDWLGEERNGWKFQLQFGIWSDRCGVAETGHKSNHSLTIQPQFIKSSLFTSVLDRMDFSTRDRAFNTITSLPDWFVFTLFIWTDGQILGLLCPTSYVGQSCFLLRLLLINH